MFDDLRDLYQEVILDHGRRPRNFRRLDGADRAARGDNPMCGDRMELWLRLGPAGEIADAAFQGRGCAISIDRKSTRLNSSHANISYAVFCLKKKKTQLIGS